MQDIKQCQNCKYDGSPPGSDPCHTCIDNRYQNGPGQTVVFTEWQEMPINAEDWMREIGCDTCALYPDACPLDDAPDKKPCVHHCTKPKQLTGAPAPAMTVRVVSMDDIPRAFPGIQGIGMKHDKGKPRLGILIREFAKELEGVGAVLTFGANKYEEGSWMHVPDAVRRYEDAFMRHLLAIKRKEHFDVESGLPHVYHALTNLMFLAYFYEKENASV